MKKFYFLTGLIVVGLVFGITQAYAGAILPFFETGTNQFSDEDREYLIDNNFTEVGQIDVGDSFRGVINFNTLNSGSANIGGTTGNNELSGIFQIMVSDITVVGTTAIIDWVADPAFEAVYGTGAIAAIYEDPSTDYAGDFDDPPPSAAPPADTDSDLAFPIDDGTVGPRTIPPSSADVSTGANVTEEAFIATGTNGTHVLTLGFLGLAGEGVQSVTTAAVGLNVLNFFNFSSGSSLADTNLGLNTLYIDPVWDAVLDINRTTNSVFGGTVDWAGSQQQRGVNDLDTPFEIATNTNFSVNLTVVPEPSTLFLLGCGLLGFAAVGRRKMRD